MSSRHSWTALAAAAALSGSVIAEVAPQGLNESGAVLRALASNTAVRLLVNGRAYDSLTLYEKQGRWLPAVALFAGADYQEGTYPLDVDAAASLQQALPGGATVSASGAWAQSTGPDGSVPGALDLGVAVTQPLLRNAWRWSQPAYDIRIQMLDEQRSVLQFKRDVAARLTRIRGLFWDLHEKSRLLANSAADVARSQRVLVAERTKYAIGETAQIDTLRASLQYLKTRRAHLVDSVSFTRSRHALAIELAMPTDSLVIADAVDYSVAPLPDNRVLLQAVRSYDPQRAVFEILYEKLSLQLQHSRRSLLPDFDASASYRTTVVGGDWQSASDHAVISVVARYALPTRGRRSAVARADIALRNNQLSAREHELQLLREVAELVDTWETQRTALEISGAAVKVAGQYLQAAQVGYELGSIRQLEYLDAADEASAEQVRHVVQQIALKKMELAFDELTGAVFSKFGVVIE